MFKKIYETILAFARAEPQVILAVSLLLTFISASKLSFIPIGDGLMTSVYLLVYFLVSYKILLRSFRLVMKGKVFTEFLLMSIATLGALYLGEYMEAIAVMVFYLVGEFFQERAVGEAERDIEGIVEARKNRSLVKRNGDWVELGAEDIQVEDEIKLPRGEQVPVDAMLMSEQGYFDTSTISGESMARAYTKGETVLSGFINTADVVLLQAKKLYEDSAFSRILELIRNARSHKGESEEFIRKFARIYTPLVSLLAVLICVLPMFFVRDYDFHTWLYRAMIFLVISCPCALVISIPLGYFAGIGAAAKKGILIKGGNFLDLLATLQAVGFDKTGTITEGNFEIVDISLFNVQRKNILPTVIGIEENSSHPIARALCSQLEEEYEAIEADEVRELQGKGMYGKVGVDEYYIGSDGLLEEKGVQLPEENGADSAVYIAKNGALAAKIVLGDSVKSTVPGMLETLRALGVKFIGMYSGDRKEVVESVARSMKLDDYQSELLPEEKLSELKRLGAKYYPLAYTGDGINDAPSLAAADIGIGMGGGGADLSIESADVVIPSDNPALIAEAVRIGKKTKRIIWQNVFLALTVKILVLVLGSFGMASMWQAIIADVGVALLAVFNTLRIR